jgi:hypothetical protein
MEMVKLDLLQPHPKLSTFPLLAQEQLEVLVRSVADHGILTPLTAIRTPEGGGLVINGRNRLAAAQANLLGSVPVDWAPDGTDPVVWAIETAIASRQLTKSGIVLLLLEQHPEMEKARKTRGNFALKFSQNPNDSRCDLITTNAFKLVSERYGVPREYFSHLLSIRDGCKDEEWMAVRRTILAGESSIPALLAGVGGKVSTKGKNRKDPEYARLITAATKTVANAFRAWGKIKFRDDRHVAITENNLHEMLVAMPDPVRRIQAQVIVESWPTHETAELLKALKAKK